VGVVEPTFRTAEAGCVGILEISRFFAEPWKPFRRLLLVTTRRRRFQRFISIRSNIVTDVKMISAVLRLFLIFYSTPPAFYKESCYLHSRKAITWPAHLNRRFLPKASTCPNDGMGGGCHMMECHFDGISFEEVASVWHKIVVYVPLYVKYFCHIHTSKPKRH
jgi:hypothetical protein